MFIVYLYNYVNLSPLYTHSLLISLFQLNSSQLLTTTIKWTDTYLKTNLTILSLITNTRIRNTCTTYDQNKPITDYRRVDCLSNDYTSKKYI